MTAYFSQMNFAEIKSMYGVEINCDTYEDDCDGDFEENTLIPEEDICRRCDSRGCSYCLMLDF